MRTYDVYRYNDLVARIRILDSGKIEWAYRQNQGNWQGFWWSNETKFTIDEIIKLYPDIEELDISEFRILRCGT
jgi:hypothetical protein